MSGEEKITFGIELEFLTLLPPAPRGSEPGHASYNYRKSLGRLSVCNTLAMGTSVPLAAECHHTSRLPCAICDSVKGKGRQEPFGEESVLNIMRRADPDRIPGMSARTEYFQVELEALRADPEEKREMMGLEIKTPVFKSQEVRSGLPKLASCIRALGNGEHEVQINDACGLHLHVGLTSGMELLVAKKVVTLVVLIEEPLLRALTPGYRRLQDASAPIATDSQLAKGMELPQEVLNECLHESTLTSQMKAHVPSLRGLATLEHSPKDIRQTLTRLWQIRSLYDLEDALCCTDGLRCGLALCLRSEEAKIVKPRDFESRRGWEARRRQYQVWEHSPSSIEFRYPEMTFDLAMIRAWVETVEKIMCIARLEEQQYRGVLRGVMVDLDEEGEIWEVLLSRLGLNHQTAFWRSRIGK